MLTPGYGGRSAVGNYTEPGVSADTPTAPPHRHAWALLAPLIASTDQRVRLATRQRGRLEYGAATERDLTAEAPTRPAAVRLYNKHGQCSALALDFDAHDRTPEQCADVAHDVFQAEALLDQAGAAYITDRAHGGAHVYVLLDQPLDFLAARELVEAMARRWDTLDPSPHQSIDSGCITAPGSPHRLGGRRELTTSPAVLAAIAAGFRTPAAALKRLRTWLCEEIAAVRAHRAPASPPPADEPTVYEPSIGRVMAASYQDLAQTGDYTAHGYPSPSEARAAVLMSARAAGLTREDVAARMHDGRWPGLWALHAHRPNPGRLFAQEWARIDAKVTASPVTSAKTAHTSDTSDNSHRGADPPGTIRTWRSTLHAVEAHEFPGAPGWTRRLLLRAIAKQAHEVGSTLTATGIRGLALATGLSHETVATLLRELASAPDPWIVRVARAQGRNAASYTLRIPDRHQTTAATTPWVRGKAHAIRPVFERLGAPPALVYEAIEQLNNPTADAIQSRTGLHRNTVREALACLAGWHLIGRVGEAWTVTSTDADLARLAERFGITRARAARVTLFREQRRRWWAYLTRFVPGLVEPDQVYDTDAEDLLHQMRLDELAASPPPRHLVAVA